MKIDGDINNKKRKSKLKMDQTNSSEASSDVCSQSNGVILTQTTFENQLPTINIEKENKNKKKSESCKIKILQNILLKNLYYHC